MPNIGVLSVQGDFAEHSQVLDRIGVEVTEVRLPQQLDDLDGLIIPGGESTTIVQLIDIYGFRQHLFDKVKEGLAVWGTCAGMIVVASKLKDKRPAPLGLMDIVVTRNAFGRQVDSFETDIEFDGIAGPAFHAVFIRAPAVDSIGPHVIVLAELDNGTPVAVQQDRLLATSFHPELTDDTRVHEYFLSIV